ncbi:MAG: OmpH family outer membrane protein, partial [Candidatus Baltobacteraceae bacterium]
SQVDTMRARHEKELQAYQNELQAGIMKQIRAHATTLQAQTQTQLQARQQQVSQQLAALSGPRLPANLPPATKAQLEQIASNLQQRYQTDLTKISDQFNQTRSDLEAQYEALNGVDVGAVGAAKQERDKLAKERGDLYKKIEDQIAAAARRIAKRDGFSVVLLDPIAHPGGYDLTGDVISSLKSTGT